MWTMSWPEAGIQIKPQNHFVMPYKLILIHIFSSIRIEDIYGLRKGTKSTSHRPRHGTKAGM